MPNPLTGDFDAALQVSGGTINRLLASMHQNRTVDPGRPSFPHSIALRVGDERVVNGVRGTLWAQLSVPRIELIHGSTDRFVLEVALRARFKADPATAPLPEFINGTIRATYQLTSIDPNCWGWRRIAADYVWPRVEEDSVSFDGTAADDVNVFEIPPVVGDDDVNVLVTRQIVALLKTQFAATPHKLSNGFGPASLRSLNVGGESAVVTPLEMGTGAGPGRIETIDQVFLGGNHFAVAVSADYILSKAQSILDDLKARLQFYVYFRHRTYLDLGPFGDVDIVEVRIDYRVGLTAATAEWAGGWNPQLGFQGGVITIKLRGEATTDKSEFNISFDITQLITLAFDWTIEGIALGVPGPPSVDVHAGGLFGGAVESQARAQIEGVVKAEVEELLNQLRGQLRLPKDGLVTELQKLDAQAGARFGSASFSPDGLVVRGRISLTPLRPPAITFVKTAEEDGFSAFQSWIPGGRIDRFGWSWSWFNGAGSPGGALIEDRFLLRRPHGVRTKFGRMKELRQPLPGLDGMGIVCLHLTGAQVDPRTGDLVEIEGRMYCTHFGIELSLYTGGRSGRLLLRDYGERNPEDPRAVRETGLEDVQSAAMGDGGFNTLVVRTGQRWDRRIAATLVEGLAASVRQDAGLLVLVLFPDGSMTQSDTALNEELRELEFELESALIVNEDVRGGWSEALGITSDEEPAWRLLSPYGGISWTSDGHASAEELTAALDTCLFPSGPPGAGRERARLSVGTRMPPNALDPVFGGIADFACPPPPVGRGLGRVLVAFVRADSLASRDRLERLRRDHDTDDDVFLAVVVDEVPGASGADAQSGELAGVVDPTGVIATRFGVRHWPTVVELNDLGRVTAIDIGAHIAESPPKETA